MLSTQARRRSVRFRLVLAGSLAAVAGPAWAAQQDDPEEAVSQAVVQPIPNLDTMQLNAALAQLGRNPRDVGALVDAGRAAMAIGDGDAAIGFFRRAQQLAPADPRVKAGLAGALVRGGDPFTAIPMFAEAEAGGAISGDMSSDRGLAYDLVGDSARAQRYYRQAIALAPNDETLRRLAISLALTGDRASADGALAPLLARGDKAAQRTRAFVYAILGQTEEAVAIANTAMPSDLAAAMAPYLRYMRTLTKPQQAAAANLGVFPRASEIGREDPRMAAFAPPKPPVVVAAAAPAQTGRPARSRRERERLAEAETARQRRPGSLIPAPAAPQPQRQANAPARTAPPAVAPAPVPPPEPVVAREVELPPIDSPPPVPSAVPEPVRVAVAEPAPAPAPAPPPAATPAPASAPGFTTLGQGEAAKEAAAFDLAATRPAPAPVQPAPQPAPPPAAVIAPPPVSTPPPAPQPARTVSLAEAFSDFAAPAPRDTAPAPGAVDIRRIQPVREGAAAATNAKPGTAEAAKPGTGRNARTPAPPSHPSRIWVQVATGRDKAALGFDWRRMARQSAALLRDKRGYVSAWGQTNRLLTGPFESEAAANAFIAQLRRADIDGAFVWTSPAGQVVDALGGR